MKHGFLIDSVILPRCARERALAQPGPWRAWPVWTRLLVAPSVPCGRNANWLRSVLANYHFCQDHVCNKWLWRSLRRPDGTLTSTHQSVRASAVFSTCQMQAQPLKKTLLLRSCLQQIVVEKLSQTRRHIDWHASERQSVSSTLDMSDARVQYLHHDAELATVFPRPLPKIQS